jgi:hypothetical protein
MTERCDSHHILTFTAPWLSNRRARPCRPSVTGQFLPAHNPPGAICLNHGPLMGPLPLPNKPMMRGGGPLLPG